MSNHSHNLARESLQHFGRTDDLEANGEVESLMTDITSTLANGNESELKTLVAQYPVLLISKTTCAFSVELKRTLAGYGVKYACIEANLTNSGIFTTMKSAIATMYQQKTFPLLLVEGKSYGGCDDVKKLERNKELFFLAPHMTYSRERWPRVPGIAPLLAFPDTVNNNVVRLTSGIVCVVAILCIAFWDTDAVPWVSLSLAIDYFLRFTWGAAPSPLGQVATFFTARLKPDFRTGAPKQFAAFCGLFFTTLSTGLWLGGQDVGGAVVMGCLLGAASLEFTTDFCVGCYFFGLGVQFNLLPKSLYRASINLKGDKAWAWQYTYNDPTVFEQAPNERVLLPNQTVPTDIDLIRKDRVEAEYKQKDFGLIRFTKVECFGMPMSLVALALAYNMLVGVFVSSDLGITQYSLRRVRGVRDGLAIGSAVLFVSFGILFLLRCVLYTKKVVKEWQHPTSRNFFSSISICLCLYGILMYPYDRYYAVAMVWIGAAFQMFLTVSVISRLIFDHHSEELINPSVLMAPVGNFVAALALASYPYNGSTGAVAIQDFGVNYVFIARYWFAVAMLFLLTLFTITFRKSFTDSHADVRVRPTIWVWQAAFSVAGPALYSVSLTGVDTGRSMLYQSFFHLAMFLFAINAVGWVRGFFSQVQDMSVWIFAFANAALAITAIHYYSFVVGDAFIRIIMYSTLAIASASSLTCFGQTCAWIFDGSLFRPKPKWGPMTFMKLSHEAMRVGLPRLGLAVNELALNVPFTLDIFLAQMKPFLELYQAHAEQEEKVIFPAGRAYFPNLNPSMDEEHQFEHAVFERFEGAVEVLSSYRFLGEAAAGRPTTEQALAAIAVFKTEFEAFSDHLKKHMRNEESTITVVVRKYLSLEQQKDITRRAYDIISASRWHHILPYVLDSLPHPVWKTRFLRSFIWAMPERAQELGMIAFRGCDSATFAYLSDEIPEIIPRGLVYYRKKY